MMLHDSNTASPLLTDQRQALIAEALEADGRVLAGALAARFGVSEDTIRRDLREMAAEGLCRRVYGGALPAAPDDGTLFQRSQQDMPRKSALARALIRMIVPGSSLFLDAGSTNLAVAEALPAEAGLTVVTNAPAIAATLAGRTGFEIIVVGGRLDVPSGACLGPQVLRDLERFRFSALVLGACGVDAEAGVTAHVFEEAQVKAAAAARSASILVAATNEKIGTAAAFHVVPADRITRLVIEADCAARLIEPFEARTVSITRAEPIPTAGSMRRTRKPAHLRTQDDQTGYEGPGPASPKETRS